MELSVEEKAQRYDKALEQLREMMPNWERLSYNGKTFLQDLIHILPELQESEDEEIRRALIKGTKVPGVEFFRAVTKANEEFITRLMQGEQELTDRYRAVIKSNEEFIARLMQGKQKPTDKCEGCNNAKGCVACVDGSEWAHIEEHKPAWSEEDEPKSHEGDWVVNNNGEPQLYQVTERSWPDSKIKRVANNLELFINTATLDRQYHLWTIQDAKDGDVLAAHECLVLFREIDGLNIKCYCTYHFMNNPSFYVGTLQNKDAFHPATKEQRDTLMKAMADAGYTFDFEKKELKKIEQKVAWSEEDKQLIEEASEYLRKYANQVQGGNSKVYVQSIADRIESLKDRYTWKPSKEQIMALRWVLNHIPYNSRKEEINGLLEQIMKLREEWL